MKKYLLILIVAIFCLPNEGFAQRFINIPNEMHDRGWDSDPWRRMSNVTSESTWLKMTSTGDSYHRNPAKPKKRKPKYPIIKENDPFATEIVKNEETGLSTVRWNNGAVYVGETDHGEINGTGTMIYPDSSKYQGQWKEDHWHGVGTLEYANGSIYCGQWNYGNPHGYGTFINPEGVKYTAKFDKGKPRGKCIIQDIDGRLYTGRWSNGRLQKKSIKPLEEK